MRSVTVRPPRQRDVDGAGAGMALDVGQRFLRQRNSTVLATSGKASPAVAGLP
jgi:hypothetical protein